MGKIQSWALTTVEVKVSTYQDDAFQAQDEDQSISSSQSEKHQSFQVQVTYNAEILKFIFLLGISPGLLELGELNSFCMMPAYQTVSVFS